MRFTRCTMPPVRLKKTLYVNKANFLTLYSHKEPFYAPQGMWDAADRSHMFPHREFFMT